MSRREANTDIRCNVEKCAYHCGEQNYCSLRSIHVGACEDCASKEAQQESYCASFKSR